MRIKMNRVFFPLFGGFSEEEPTKRSNSEKIRKKKIVFFLARSPLSKLVFFGAKGVFQNFLGSVAKNIYLKILQRGTRRGSSPWGAEWNVRNTHRPNSPKSFLSQSNARYSIRQNLKLRQILFVYLMCAKNEQTLQNETLINSKCFDKNDLIWACKKLITNSKTSEI